MIEESKKIEWYRNNPEVVDFICDFFEIKKRNRGGKGESGIRTRVIQDIYNKREPIHYCSWDKKCLVGINKENFWQQIKLPGVLHFREVIYDKGCLRVLDESKGEYEGYEFEENRIGISVCFDIDAPHIKVGDGKDGKGGKKEIKGSMFECWDDFNKAKVVAEKELEETGRDWNCIWSGNGAYLITETWYAPIDLREDDTGKNGIKVGTGDKNNYFWDVKIASKIMATFRDINLIFKDKGIRCHIDEIWKFWSIFHKSPFVAHGVRDVLSIPVPKGELDLGWMKNNTITGIGGDGSRLEEIDVSDIMKQCNWRQIW